MLQKLISTIKLLFCDDKEFYGFIYRLTGYYPRHIDLYRLALAHRSSPLLDDQGNPTNNERLEYLGDAVLDLVVADYLYRRFPNESEGFLTTTRSRIVSRESLNRLGEEMKVARFIRAATRSASAHNSHLIGNVMEALVGAVYLDHGYRKTTKFIEQRLIHDHVDIEKVVTVDPNYKSQIIEWAQKYHVTAEFKLLDSHTDDDKNTIFRTAVVIAGQEAARATGYSKKESHQHAAKKAMRRLRGDKAFRQRVLGKNTAGDSHKKV